MARTPAAQATPAAYDLRNPKHRAALPHRTHPYFFKVKKNHFLGWRKQNERNAPRWFARVQYGREKSLDLPLGTFEEVSEATPALAPIMQLMLMTPIRPGALAAARVEDYDRAQHKLYIRKDKARAGRTVALPDTPECRALMAAALHHGKATKIGAAVLFPDGDGKEWTSKSWCEAVQKLREAEVTPEGFTLYWLRHTRITELVGKSHPLVLIAEVAGTSAAIIEKHYVQKRDEVIRAMLAA